MAMDVSSIRTGMEVFGADGAKIGSIVEIRPPRGESDDAGPAAGQSDASPETADPGYTPPRATPGTLPSGATTAKDRGVPTGLGAASLHDIKDPSGTGAGMTPGAGGLDAFRGYGMEGTNAGDTDVHVTNVSAPGMMDAPGTTSGLARAGSAADLGMTRGAGAQGGDTDNAAVAPPPAGATSAEDEAGGATTATGYFVVQDPGFLGVGGRALRVPFEAVREVDPGRGVILDSTADQCRARYGGRPGLDINPEGTPVER